MCSKYRTQDSEVEWKKAFIANCSINSKKIHCKNATRENTLLGNEETQNMAHTAMIPRHDNKQRVTQTINTHERMGNRWERR